MDVKQHCRVSQMSVMCRPTSNYACVIFSWVSLALRITGKS